MITMANHAGVGATTSTEPWGPWCNTAPLRRADKTSSSSPVTCPWGVKGDHGQPDRFCLRQPTDQALDDAACSGEFHLRQFLGQGRPGTPGQQVLPER